MLALRAHLFRKTVQDVCVLFSYMLETSEADEASSSSNNRAARYLSAYEISGFFTLYQVQHAVYSEIADQIIAKQGKGK